MTQFQAIIFVQARMSSQRLPGKVLKSVQGKVMLQYLIDRLRLLDFPLVVLTSEHPSDALVSAYCTEQNIPVFRGPLERVADRFLGAAEVWRCSHMVRISGDSPMLDPQIVKRALQHSRQHPEALISNVFPRSFPKGQSVEVIPVSLLKREIAHMSAEDQEHVTPLFYRKADAIEIVNFEAQEPLRPLGPLEQIQMSVDTPEDFAQFESLVQTLPAPFESYSYLELIEAMRSSCL